ncbi:MAG TPA: BsuPI-related putative proteinase inhibitor [Sedimentisphaerales bacterium]|nr:BsuPI-related putative proteinase inhibitor [Sedimentisphaerales bacterium]
MKERTTTLAAAIILVGACQAHALFVDSNSIVQDGIQYYIDTDKSLYDLGDNVQMLYTVTNLQSQQVTFHFGQSPEWNFWVEKGGEEVWSAVKGWWTEVTSFTLQPAESKDFSYTWNMRDDNDELVGTGVYTVIGGLWSPTGGYEHTEVTVPITIVPEPSSGAMLLAGLIILLKRRSS